MCAVVAVRPAAPRSGPNDIPNHRKRFRRCRPTRPIWSVAPLFPRRRSTGINRLGPRGGAARGASGQVG
jgi:hypothetical protein